MRITGHLEEPAGPPAAFPSPLLCPHTPRERKLTLSPARSSQVTAQCACAPLRRWGLSSVSYKAPNVAVIQVISGIFLSLPLHWTDQGPLKLTSPDVSSLSLCVPPAAALSWHMGVRRRAGVPPSTSSSFLPSGQVGLGSRDRRKCMPHPDQKLPCHTNPTHWLPGPGGPAVWPALG